MFDMSQSRHYTNDFTLRLKTSIGRTLSAYINLLAGRLIKSIFY